MSTAFLKRSLHDLEFSVGRRLPMEQHQAWTCVLPASETQQLSRRTAAAASARRRAFEKGIVNSVHWTAAPRIGQIALSYC